jgi:hypothetical protein
MILWRRTIGVGLGLVAASSLWTGAQAYPVQEEMGDTSLLIQVDDSQVDALQTDNVHTDNSAFDPAAIEAMPVALHSTIDTGSVEALAAEMAPVTSEVLERLSQEKLEAIAAIISTAEPVGTSAAVTELPVEVLAQLDTLPVLEQQVGRRRWLPTGLVRRLRLPQIVASLLRQPKNAALVMLGNHIVVVNPVTGAVLGAVLSAL